MGRKLGVCLIALFVGGLAAGCRRPPVQNKVPPDPLLQSKKPVEGRPRLAGSGPPGRDQAPLPPFPGREGEATAGQGLIPPGTRLGWQMSPAGRAEGKAIGP